MVSFFETGIDTVSPDDLLCDLEEAKGNKGLPHGIRPSDKEVEEHERTHVPFRSWCQHCVKGKAKSHPHWNSKKEEEYGMPVISWDYFYIKMKTRMMVRQTMRVRETKDIHP